MADEFTDVAIQRVPPQPIQSANDRVALPAYEPLAVASAACGLFAVIPVVTQVAGIVLGVIGLRRIRRLERQGGCARGRAWAWVGIGSSGFGLLCWLVVFAGMLAVGWAFRSMADGLPTVAGN